MKFKVSKEDYMNDQIGFEMAMRRVQDQAHREGKKPTFGELTKLAQIELEREYERNKASVEALPDDAPRA